MNNPNLLESPAARRLITAAALCGALGAAGCKESRESAPLPLGQEFSLDADSYERFKHPQQAKIDAEKRCDTIFAAARCNPIDMSDLPGRGHEQIAGNQKRLTGQAGLMLFEHQTISDKNSPTGKGTIVVSYDDSGSYKSEAAFYKRNRSKQLK